jgi:hypothetical protein
MRPTRARARSRAAARWFRQRAHASAANLPENRSAGALARRLRRRALSFSVNCHHPIDIATNRRAARGRRRGVAAAVLLRWLLEISPFAADAGRGGVAQPAAGLTGCPCVLGRGISVTRIRTLMARRRHTTGLPPPLADSTASAAAFRRAGRQLPLSGIKILGPGLISVRPEFTAALIRIHIDP